MFLEIENTAPVPALQESGNNDSRPQFWRLRNETQTLRIACLLGELSVWHEGPKERELFRVNLGVLAETARRARVAGLRAARSRKTSAAGLAPLTEAESAAVWRACAADPELRFSASLRITPASLGGWRRCLELAGRHLRAFGRFVPWEDAGLTEPGPTA
jgi:hypothetical protein